MIASMAAELLKLRKRPAAWVLGSLLCGMVIMFGYVFTYLGTLISLPNSDPSFAAFIDEQRQALLPAHIVATVIPLLAGLGGPIGLVLGAMAVSSEYSWGTIKTVLTQRSARLHILAGKLLSLGVTLVVFVLLAFAAAGASSLILAYAMGGALVGPAAFQLAQGMGAAWLILGAWTLFGALLATLMRSTAFAIGFGLIWLLVLETIVKGLSTLHSSLNDVPNTLLSVNTSALAQPFSGPSIMVTIPPPPSPTHAAMVLGMYILGCAALASLVFMRRDVA